MDDLTLIQMEDGVTECWTAESRNRTLLWTGPIDVTLV